MAERLCTRRRFPFSLLFLLFPLCPFFKKRKCVGAAPGSRGVEIPTSCPFVRLYLFGCSPFCLDDLTSPPPSPRRSSPCAGRTISFAISTVICWRSAARRRAGSDHLRSPWVCSKNIAMCIDSREAHAWRARETNPEDSRKDRGRRRSQLVRSSPSRLLASLVVVCTRGHPPRAWRVRDATLGVLGEDETTRNI